MLEVIPEPEFEAWYQSLPAAIAEEVTAAIDLVASSDGRLSPDALSPLLLWYDGVGAGSEDRLVTPLLGASLGPLALRARAYVMWRQEVLLGLDSAPLKRRLRALDPARAAHALKQIEKLKRQLHAVKVTSSHAAWLTAGVADYDDSGGVRKTFLELLASMDLDPELVVGSGSGLRELCVDDVSPPQRVIFGLDVPGRRLIAILGEALDRRYYGDSVRRAEQRWQRYCEQRAGGSGASAR